MLFRGNVCDDLAALDNDWPCARSSIAGYYRLIIGNFLETNPSPVKCILAMMGRIAGRLSPADGARGIRGLAPNWNALPVN